MKKNAPPLHGWFGILSTIDGWENSKGTINKQRSLQKQIGCFNLRVVTMVADKLKRQWLLDGMED